MFHQCFAFLPTGSAVVVQHEDGGPWTHETIVGTGHHNHHDHAYTIQLTTNGRQITQNRLHSNPYQSQKTHTYGTTQQNNLTQEWIHWQTY